jgi:hypothetical protein
MASCPTTPQGWSDHPGAGLDADLGGLARNGSLSGVKGVPALPSMELRANLVGVTSSSIYEIAARPNC